MNTIDLHSVDRERNQGHSSKGDQPKWLHGGKWYKADHMGYESLAEVLISKLLTKSNIPSFVAYAPVRIAYERKETTGCISQNFRAKNEMLVPIERLHRSYQGIGLAAALAKLASTKERIRYTVDFIESVTALEGVGAYLTAMLELDAFFLNEDRHTNNIAVIRNEDTKAFRFCPIFDNGLALLSDTNDYLPETDIYGTIARVRAKPFDADFFEQMSAAEELYGAQLKFTFTKTDVTAVLNELSEYYDERTLRRVEDVVFEQMRRYPIFWAK